MKDERSKIIVDLLIQNYEYIIIIIIAIILVATYYLKLKNKKKRCTSKTEGKIIAIKPFKILTYEYDPEYNKIPHHTKYITKYNYIAEYKIENKIYLTSNIKASIIFKEKGTIVEVHYNPKNPSESFIEINDLKELEFFWKKPTIITIIAIIISSIIIIIKFINTF